MPLPSGPWRSVRPGPDAGNQRRAHHAWRLKLVDEREALSREKEDLEEATVWVDRAGCSEPGGCILFCADLSATPFYIHSSGQIEGSPFPWLVSDFGLVDAIESGIVKIPRLPVSDTTGRPEPKYFRIWQNHILANLQPGDYLPGRQRKPKPERVYEEAEPALLTLAGPWEERFKYIQEASDEKDKTPPVLIVICDNTDIAEVFYRKISGEETIEAEVAEDAEGDEDAEDEEPQVRSRSRRKARTVYGTGACSTNTSQPDDFPTVRIDTKLLREAEAVTHRSQASSRRASSASCRHS
jgi:type III restriction enzyme